MIRTRLSGFKARLIVTYLAVFLVSAAIVAGQAGTTFSQSAIDSAQSNLEIQAYVLALVLQRPWAVSEGDIRGLFALPQFQDLNGVTGLGGLSQMSIYDGHGNLLATSLSSAPDNQRQRPEIASAIAGSVSHDVRYDSFTRQVTVYAAAPVQGSGHVIGVVQIGTPLAQITARIQRFWLGLGLTVLVAAAVASIAGWWLAGQLVRPVGKLRDAASRLASGNLDERVQTVGPTELAQLGEAFNDMAHRIQQTILRERTFVANASHELRTPLTNIKLRAEALKDGALEDPAVAHKFVDEIESEANRLSRLASELLALARQDAALAPAREPINAAQLVNKAIESMGLRAERSGIRLATNLESSGITLSGDPSGLEVMLLNLLDNALQYTPADGTIAVTTLLSADQKSLVLTVQDTGSGIPAEDLPHIFERFYRADKARSRRQAQRVRGPAQIGSGAGLGLAIVKGIVEEHGGAITAASTPGIGTTMTVVLPVPRSTTLTAVPEPDGP